MRGFPFGIRRQDFDTGIEHHESHQMPHLLNTSSGSSSSQDGPHRHGKQRRSKKSHHHHSDAPDNSILRGAEILRRQLMSADEDDDNVDDGQLYGAEHAPQIHSLSLEELTDENDYDDGDEWSDPWTPKSRHTRAGSLVCEETEEKTAFSSPVGDAAEWARLSDDEDDGGEGRPQTRKSSPRKHHHRSKRISPETSPESQKDSDPSIRQKVRSHFQREAANEEGYYDEDIGRSSSNDRNYLPGGLVRNVTPDRIVTSDRRPRSPAHWENPSEVVSNHAMVLLKDLESEERALQHLNCEEEMTYLLEASEYEGSVMMELPVVDDSPKFPSVVSPRSRQFEKLKQDPAYQHAQRAGILWQSLLSQHVRFPSSWWNGARSPPMGVSERRMWTYMGRHRVGGNRYLNGMVKSRGSAGRLLLHLVVRDIVTLSPVQDIAVGCFHPNARGIRTASEFDPTIEDSRDIWVALRKRSDEVSVMDSLLKLGDDDDVSASPLGGRHAVDNNNMRAVFGETPPVQTVFVLESELYEVFSHFMDTNIPPAAILLGRYLKDWY